MGYSWAVGSAHQIAPELLAFRRSILAGPRATEVEPQRNRLALSPDARRRHAAWSLHEPSLPALRHRGIFAPGPRARDRGRRHPRGA